jgi:hypothetical protein
MLGSDSVCLFAFVFLRLTVLTGCLADALGIGEPVLYRGTGRGIDHGSVPDFE